MPVNIKALNKPARFNYPDEEGEEWVELRLVSSEKMDEFRKEIGVKPKSKFIVNPISKRMESVMDVDIPEEKASAFADLCLDYQIADWNLMEPDETPIDCTIENKKLLMNGEPTFDAWVSARFRKLQGNIDEIGDAELKN